MTTPTVPSFNDIDGDTFTKMWDTIKDKKTDFTADEVNKFQKVIIVIIIILLSLSSFYYHYYHYYHYH